MDPEGARVFESVLASGGPVLFGPAYDLQLPAHVAERFGIRSQMAMAIYPKGDKPYLFGLHQCSYPRVWTAREQELFGSIGGRLTDSLTSLLIFRSLRESERKLEEAQRIAHLGHWERDFARGRATVSEEGRRIFGVSPEEATAELAEWSEHWLNLIHPDDRERMKRTLAAALQSREPYETEYRVVRSDGEMRVVHTRGSVTLDESGRPRRMFGVVQDITDVRRAEEHLRASEARFRTFVDHATDAFMLHDVDSTIVDVNRQACETLGYGRDELIGTTPAGSFSPFVTSAMREQIRKRLQSGETFSFETRHRRRDGTVFPVEVRVRSFRDGDRDFYLSLARDITERERAEAERVKLEERLRQAEKMEAIGRFASGIAHDFNNVLGGIIAYGEMLFDEAPEDAPRKRYAQNVLTAATRGRDLIDQILAYTRSQRGKRRPTDVCRTAVETLELLRSSLPDSITLYPTIPDEPLVVMGDATQLHQIVMNLCSNAIHAMADGGALRVAITPQDLGADLALSHGTLRSGRYARVSVEDSGCGMDEATLARIFEPFFTTKEVGRGTGLGLALVQAIVSDFGGVIDVKSVPAQGSTFSIYLPLADVPSSAAAA
jgi:PAS domain S-box-containing protein